MTNITALYYAFAVDIATIFFFIFYHDDKLPPIRTQYPKVGCLSLGDFTQSTLDYPTI